MKRIVAILGVAVVMSVASVGSVSANYNNGGGKCKVKKTNGKLRVKGKDCDRILKDNSNTIYYVPAAE